MKDKDTIKIVFDGFSDVQEDAIRKQLAEIADVEDSPRGVYGEWCRDPQACAHLGYCPKDPTCGD